MASAAGSSAQTARCPSILFVIADDLNTPNSSSPQGPANDGDDIFAAAYPAPRYPVDEDGIREFRQAYADCISFTDAQFGKVLVALANSPMRPTPSSFSSAITGFIMANNN